MFRDRVKIGRSWVLRSSCGRIEVSVRTMKASRKAMGLPVCEATRFLEEPRCKSTA